MERLKRIVFTVTNDLNYDQRMQRISTSLQKAGFAVTLVGFLKKRSIKTEPRTFHQVRLRLLFKKGKLFYIEYNFRLFWWLLFRRFDIYGGIDLDTLLPVFLNARLKGKPVVYDAHEYFTELPEIVDRPLIKKMWLRLERFLLPKIKYNYTVGQKIAEVLQQKYKQPCAVIRNVPLLQEAQSDVIRKNNVIYQGALNKGRGIENLMLAMKDVDAELLIAGEGDLSAELREMAAGLPHKNKIRFLGYVRPDTLRNITAETKVGVNLVENLGLSYYYSLSNKFFDYIHAGLPQVTMNFPEYAALNDQYKVAILIEGTAPETIAAAVNKLLLDEQLYSELRINTQTAKLKLNWQEEEKKLLNFYQNIE